MNIEKIEIRKIKKLDHKQFKAKVDVAFHTDEFGVISIKGFRIGNSKFGGMPWVEPPSYQMFGKYEKCLFLEGEGVWEQLVTFLIDKCIEEGIELVVTATDSEVVDPEEIPF
ncbi:hypothetical protein COV24_02955 [candidate division WWE3 bacterium CG10_big_fil_rev_8_21_14_0_10_32_10]|uniref:Uncharacterized protein n=1 Tax=candidate division WWE3 bacterium CG10_big_fil_rev_8_21_14_0_10_32_10 TaxID=1975090 RepID=A0A2H0RA34_UNCKA|nr:MAG: hypothetical protein COV24_02955 [candidate division WWE3 bacterium CG10_big_fil_rev_8_21_14_0_10_32_10]